MQLDILRELGSPAKLRKSLDVVEIVLGFLTSGGGRPSTTLVKYLKKLKMEKKTFSEKVSKLSFSVLPSPGLNSHLSASDHTLFVLIGQRALQPGTHSLSMADTVCWFSQSHYPQWSSKCCGRLTSTS